MMKKTFIISTLLLSLAPLAVLASCESVKADITQKIISNGVPESGFKLDIVPNDQVQQAGGQVVGHCENDTQKIVYTRITDGE
ncbi:lipoprotein [Yersinia thracica]|uniref:Lipoprotein n=2 Tax=Yersinia thracica TaxID=2890319 RepID=A0A0T9PWK5_9GAMM|nr:lipoprotein [Yersinia thracica]